MKNTIPPNQIVIRGNQIVRIEEWIADSNNTPFCSLFLTRDENNSLFLMLDHPEKNTPSSYQGDADQITVDLEPKLREELKALLKARTPITRRSIRRTHGYFSGFNVTFEK